MVHDLSSACATIIERGQKPQLAPRAVSAFHAKPNLIRGHKSIVYRYDHLRAEVKLTCLALFDAMCFFVARAAFSFISARAPHVNK